MRGNAIAVNISLFKTWLLITPVTIDVLIRLTESLVMYPHRGVAKNNPGHGPKSQAIETGQFRTGRSLRAQQCPGIANKREACQQTIWMVYV